MCIFKTTRVQTETLRNATLLVLLFCYCILMILLLFICRSIVLTLLDLPLVFILFVDMYFCVYVYF